MVDTLKVGIVGLGHMGRIRAREIARNPAMELVAGSDPDPEAAAAFPGIAFSADYRGVLNAGVDAVFICTPNRFTPEATIAALDAGLHVLCEKPPGRSIGDIEDIIAAEERNPQCKLKFGFNHRYHAGVQRSQTDNQQRKTRSPPLGPRCLRQKAEAAGSRNRGVTPKRSAAVGSSSIRVSTCLTSFRFFCGDFAEVKSMVTTAYWNVEVEDNAFALLRDEAGRIAMLHSSSTQWKHRFNLEVYLSEGYLSINGILTSSRSYGTRRSPWLADSSTRDSQWKAQGGGDLLRHRSSWELEVGDFADCILKDLPVTSGTSVDALKAMQLVHAIYHADRWTNSTAPQLLHDRSGEGNPNDSPSCNRAVLLR